MLRVSLFAFLAACPAPPEAVDAADPRVDPPSLEVTVQGRTCSPNGASLGGMEVAIRSGDEVFHTHSDKQGAFSVDGVPAGEIEVVLGSGHFQSTSTVTAQGGGVIVVDDDDACFSDDVAILLVTGEYDDMGALLDEMGTSYDAVNGLTREALDVLRNPSAVAEYDLIVMNCGMTYDFIHPTYTDEIAAVLADFVAEGGSIYASDWAYFTVESSHPDVVEYLGDDAQLWDPARGARGDVVADVLDPGLSAAIDSDVADVTYDLDIYAVMSDAGPDGRALLRSDLPVWSTDYTTTSLHTGVPLAVQHDHPEGGSVIVTSFHMSPQMTDDMLWLLRRFAFSL